MFKRNLTKVVTLKLISDSFNSFFLNQQPHVHIKVNIRQKDFRDHIKGVYTIFKLRSVGRSFHVEVTLSVKKCQKLSQIQMSDGIIKNESYSTT